MDIKEDPVLKVLRKTSCVKCGYYAYNCICFLDEHIAHSEVGSVGGFRFLKSDGTVGHMPDGCMSMEEFKKL